MDSSVIRELIFEANHETSRELLRLCGGVNLFLLRNNTIKSPSVLNYKWPVRDTYDNSYQNLLMKTYNQLKNSP